ncbi:MAG: hypothetical protein R2779_07045 [Crocinitomicaceae bacterium]
MLTANKLLKLQFLCASKSDVKVEYAMRGMEKPLGVATYQLAKLVKENMKQFITLNNEE